ncbi:MAG: GNAT family N-acetyltransferase [Oscillospiraceae bacterium]|nr:GNAT family N-acetyltransferase [Oscillospiraceae bacterium]
MLELNIKDYVIEKLNLSEYEKCSNIWNMSADPYTEQFRNEIEAGNRIVYVYKVNGKFLGEIAYVFDMNDSDYTIPQKRIYLSRLIVKNEYRNKGIGSILIDFVIEEIKNLGYNEISIGVDKDNKAALHLYRKKGFTKIIFDGTDELGEYYKLVKIL